MLLTFTAGTGCTALREIPREDYTARVPERSIKIVTREGLEYELESASVQGDTLVGYHRRDVEGPSEEFDTLRMPLDDVASISARHIDWYRTGLVGGLSLAAIVAAGLSLHNANRGSSSSDCTRNLDPNCTQ
jgi:hypothetical protein